MNLDLVSCQSSSLPSLSGSTHTWRQNPGMCFSHLRIYNEFYFYKAGTYMCCIDRHRTIPTHTMKKKSVCTKSLWGSKLRGIKKKNSPGKKQLQWNWFAMEKARVKLASQTSLFFALFLIISLCCFLPYIGAFVSNEDVFNLKAIPVRFTHSFGPYPCIKSNNITNFFSLVNLSSIPELSVN